MKARSRVASVAVLLALGFPFGPGCRHTELLESEIRARDFALREMKDELARLEFEKEALQRELGAARHLGVLKLPPEHATQLFALRKITLGRGTGPYDNDRLPGDDGVQIVLEPRDVEDHVIKVPGALHVAALEISPEGLKRPFSSWDLAPEQLRRYWKTGLFSTGYSLPLPWKNWPTTEDIRIVVRFQLLDGRVFETERDLKVRLAPGARPVLPMPPADPPEQAPAPTPLPAGEGPVLPPPRQLNPTAAPERAAFRPAQKQPTPGESTTGSERPAADSSGKAAPQPATRMSHWQAPSLEGAVQLTRPQPIHED